jgi:hypothetical protein
MYRITKYIWILVFSLVSFVVFSQVVLITENSNKKKKLLIYVTVQDSVNLQKTDSGWINDTACLKLKIDTIDLFLIKEHSDHKKFYYKGHIFFKSQLYNTKLIDYLSNFKITGFEINFSGAAFEPPYIGSFSNCISNEQKKQIIEYYRFSEKSNNKKSKIYFSNIKAENSIDNKTIKLNQVIFNIN